MPSSSRAAQVDLSATPYYHCMARCVRRAFLCGEDTYTGENYDHRKGWFLDRMRLATEVFTIDVCAYAVMSNHFHVVLRVDVDRATALTDEAVLRRYGRLFPFVARATRELPEREQRAHLAVLRERLSDISWFMRVINEHVARRANKEDACTGRFWEGRFKSQALLDEAALYTCMSYVDLNPVRAGVADSLKGSDFTSIQQRLAEVVRRRGKAKKASARRAVPLAPLRGEGRAGTRPMLDVRFDDYAELLEWSGRAAGAKLGGRIRGGPPAVLARMGVAPEAWLAMMGGAALVGLAALGSEGSMRAEAERRGRRWIKGTAVSRRLFRKSA